jgi:hypothetical protein
MDLHHNLFYSYRGPDTEGNDCDRQLENNVTKALINTLRLGGEPVWRPFLTWLGIADARDVKFLLQHSDLPTGHAANKRCRVLLGISQQGSKWLSEDWLPSTNIERSRENVPDSRPDAWIYGDGFAVLVESKVNDADFSPRQMARHYAMLRTSGHPPKVIPKTWREIHAFFRNLLLSLTDKSRLGDSRLLGKQFTQFLEYSRMSGFTGFQRDHFDYFLLHDDDEARRWVRGQVEDFAARAQTELYKVDPFYQKSYVGVLKRNKASCWAAFGPEPFEECHKRAHQSISVGPNGLRMFVNVEGRDATKLLNDVLRHSRSSNQFRTALQELHAIEPFELVLVEQVVKRPRYAEETLKMRLHSSLLANEDVWTAFDRGAKELLGYKKHHLLYFCIDRPAVTPSDLIKLSEDRAVDLVVKTFQRNHAVVKLLNG